MSNWTLEMISSTIGNWDGDEHITLRVLHVNRDSGDLNDAMTFTVSFGENGTNVKIDRVLDEHLCGTYDVMLLGHALKALTDHFNAADVEFYSDLFDYEDEDGKFWSDKMLPFEI